MAIFISVFMAWCIDACSFANFVPNLISASETSGNLCQIKDAGCGMRDVRCEMWDVRCGMWDVRYGMQEGKFTNNASEGDA